MDLNKTYSNLSNNKFKSNSIYLAEIISDNNYDMRLAIDNTMNPILLIPEYNFEDNFFSESNYKLNFLEINYNQLCQVNDVSDSNQTINAKFSTIKLVGGNIRMIDYFLRALEGLIIELNKDYSFQNFKKEVEILIELFSKRKSVDLKTVLGLWGELFFINQSSDITKTIVAWHNNENNRFDFSFAENQYLEVKTTLDSNRLHTFSNKQIENYKNLNVEIASIQTELNGTGKSLKDLWENIDSKIKDLNLKDKLQTLISSTLKSDFQALYEYRFDMGFAESSLKYFNTKDIPSINQPLHHSIRKISLKIDLDLV
ncbi:MAG: hypothetical protein VW298_02395 [Candidatus Woesearchaeota archaeon]